VTGSRGIAAGVGPAHRHGEVATLTAKHYSRIMLYQVCITWDEWSPLPAFADQRQAIAYAKSLLARLPEDAHPETEITVLDPEGAVIFTYSLIAWRTAVFLLQDRAYAPRL
jgi:hypothetical protein